MIPAEGYGVCRLSMVAVRNEPDFSSVWCTQLLFGDHYIVLAQTNNRKFVRIKIYSDGVEGWIDSRQHHAISSDYFDYLCRAEFKITTDVTTGMLYNKTPVVIVMGSIIPISSAELFKMEEHFAFNGEAKTLGQYRDFEYLKSQAMKYLGAPHLPGGKTPFGIDESGLVQMAYRFCGYLLPRYPEQQIRYGRPVAEPRQLLPGDLLFIRRADGGLHPAILLETTPFRVLHVEEKVKAEILPAGITPVGMRRILTAA